MEFEKILKKYRKIVDYNLNKFFNSKIKKVDNDFLRKSYGCLKEFSLRPGKRIRPISTIMAYKAIKDSNEKEIYPVSIVPELIHASTLIHDDIMDEDKLRRGKPTAHKVFEKYFIKNFSEKKHKGNLFDSSSKRFSVSMAIVQGNMLYSMAISSILKSKLDSDLKNKTLLIFEKAYNKTNEGQILDLVISAKEKSSLKDYEDVVIRKTALLLSSSIVFGAMLNNAKPYQLKYLEKYAICLGLAFQVRDDIMDLSKKSGKNRNIGTDIRKGNKTMIIIDALKKGKKLQKKFLLSILGKDNATKKEIGKCVEIIKDAGSLNYANSYANNKIKEAKRYLKEANLNEIGHEFFSNLADYVIKRKK